jgi:hypothetical protein
METQTTAWWEAYKHTLPAGYFHFIQEESEATGIACFQPAVIPGLLQTERYAQGVTAQFQRTLLSQVEYVQRIQLRLKRQWQVLEKSPPPTIHAIIDEAVLRRIVTSPDVQHEQLLHLNRLGTLPHITIQILPFSSGVIWEIFGHTPIDIFTFMPPRMPSLFMDGPLDHLQSTSNFEISHYRTSFQRMGERALTPEQSAQFIEKVAMQIREPQHIAA